MIVHPKLQIIQINPSAIINMVSTHTSSTQLAFLCIENALKGATDDQLSNLVLEIKSLYEKALEIQELTYEFNSGSI